MVITLLDLRTSGVRKNLPQYTIALPGKVKKFVWVIQLIIP